MEIVFFFFSSREERLLLLFFCQLQGFQRGLGQRMESEDVGSNSPSSPKVERTLPANYTTEFGSRAPFIKLLGVLEGKGQNYIA